MRKNIHGCNIENNCHRAIADPRLLVGWVGSCPAWCQDSYSRRALTDRVRVSVCVSLRARELRGGGCYPLYQTASSIITRACAHTRIHTHTHRRVHSQTEAARQHLL